MSVIKNTKELATTPLREDALAILESGYEAILTDKVVSGAVTLNGSQLRIKDMEINLDDFKRVFVIGIGKAAFDACSALENIVGDRITGGIVLDIRGGVLKKLKSLVGTHPLPSKQNMEATLEISDLLKQTKEDDLVLTIISGGGSALLCLPNDMTCEHVAMLTDELIKKGATISELNTVRKHTSRIQGGQLAEFAYPAHVVSLIFSDVPGNDLATIASGPTVKDETTASDAEQVLKKFDIDASQYTLRETPKDDKYFEYVDNVLILSNKTALEAMDKKAHELGYASTIEASCLEGNVQEVGPQLVRDITAPKTCKLYGGETTVVVQNSDGKGGRNQALALAALEHIQNGMLLVAAASDGWDNSDVAGVLVDTGIRRLAEQRGVSIKEHLNTNNSYSFFESVGGHIITGKTGTNVADFYITLRQ